LPPSPDSMITAEMADANTLDPNAPLDFAKIRDAFTELQKKMKKDDRESATKLPQK